SRRTTLLRVAAITWVLLISMGVVINHVTLAKLAEQTEASPVSTQVAALEQRLAELAQESEQARKQPAALPQTRYDADRQAFDRRLAALELSLDQRPSDATLQSLQTRVEQLEARLKTRATP